MQTTKEAWLNRIRNSKPTKHTISRHEYYTLYKLAKFTCPLKRRGDRMLFCDGRDCPTNMKTLETYEWECREKRRYRALILMIEMGWLRIETS